MVLPCVFPRGVIVRCDEVLDPPHVISMIEKMNPICGHEAV